MSIKIYKRNTAARRGMSIVKPEQLTDRRPEKSLVLGKSSRAGRSLGKISVRHKGGGVKRNHRLVDFTQDKLDVGAKVISIEKDPNRSALIALVIFADGEKRYILASEGMKAGEEILVSEKAPLKKGNRLPLKNIPIGTIVCNVEMFPGRGGQLARSAGSGLSLMSVAEGFAQLKMPSGEIRKVSDSCWATVGAASNFEHNFVKIGKAGRSRHMGRRPAVRGSAMNPVDHPHGGGEGRQGIGLKSPKTPWGKPALGKKTRKKKKYSGKFIIKRRK